MSLPPSPFLTRYQTKAMELFTPSKPTKLLPVPDYRQPDHFSCGATAAMSVGRYFGVGPRTIEEWKKALGTTKKNSTIPSHIVTYLKSLGLDVQTKQRMTLKDLKKCWAEGKPVICPIQEYGTPGKQTSLKYGHYVVVIGVDLGYVFVQDPSMDNVLGRPGGTQGKAQDPDSLEACGKSMIPERVWMKRWHDVDVLGRKFIRFGIIVGPKPGTRPVFAKGFPIPNVKEIHPSETPNPPPPTPPIATPPGPIPTPGSPGESWFKICPRDEQGHCLPKGAAGAQQVVPPTTQQPVEKNKTYSSPTHQRAEQFIDAELADTPELAPEQVAHYKKSLLGVFSAMPERTLKKSLANLKGIVFKTSIGELTNAFGRVTGESPPPGQKIGGFCNTQSMAKKTMMYLDGGSDIGDEYHEATLDIYGHEFTHTLDLNGEISKRPDWKDAYDTEINLESDPLSRYARKNLREAAAEFGRLVWKDKKTAKAMFPKCWAVWLACDLVDEV